MTTIIPTSPAPTTAYRVILDAEEVREGTTGLTPTQADYLDALDDDEIGAALEIAVDELAFMSCLEQVRQRAAELLLERAEDQRRLVLPRACHRAEDARALSRGLMLDPQRPQPVIVDASCVQDSSRDFADALVRAVLVRGAAERLEVRGAPMRFAGDLVQASTAHGVTDRLMASGTRRQGPSAP